MRRIAKRFLCGIISASMLFTSAVIPSVFADNETTAPSDYLVNITFDEAGTGSGSFTAAAGGAVTEKGTVAYAEGKEGNALNIASKSASNYLELADGILSGKTAATYSFWLKAGSDSVPNWPFMTTPTTGTHDLNQEKYLGMLATTSSFTVERYNNSGSRLSVLTADSSADWQYVTAVFENGSTKLYVNGVKRNEETTPVDVAALFTDTSKTWIGHANWGSGEGFSGMIDEFRIYGRALNEDEIIALAGDEYQKELDRIEAQKKAEEAKKIAAYEKLIIETHFYDALGNEIYQIAGSGDVTVETTVKNYNYGTADIEFSVNSGTPQTAQIAQAGEQTFTQSVSNPSEINVEVKDNSGSEATVYNAGKLIKADVEFPAASPADSAQTTEGVHDPTLFKDPVSGKYYVYSSHNLVFESSDLINWTKHDYTQSVTIPSDAKAFIDANYSNTTANATYWAPDILYVEGDEYPYWFYLSSSCGLGGRNSVISLVKAKSPGLWDGETQNGGIVMASKETSAYNTNAIDANIYADSDGKSYFIWGSFWKGIHAAELITDMTDENAGKVKGVDYTSDATILSSCQNFGTRMYSTPAGVAGPEGAYTVHNDETGYTYMFTSYGWLGTNYNIRVARTNQTFSSILSGANPHKQLLDYKNRPVGATYSDQVKEGGLLSEFWGYKMSGSFKLGDGIEYLGSGHNSVFKDDDGQWYLIQHCRKVADGIAYLQIKKMLWTEDGWPVVSPMVYAGEKEQTIPKDMILGTWNLSSVGHTIFESGVTDVSKSGAYKGSDLPVHSSEIILQDNGKVSGDMGTWTYDNDHTVTVTFAKDGDETQNQYFKKGDVMKLFVLAGYDKEKRKSTLVMTGIDENGITQFADKANASMAYTDVSVETEATTVEKSSGGNPILSVDGEGNLTYTGDPAALVVGDTVYLYTGHDVSTTDGYNIPEWLCYSSKNMTDWQYEGVVLKATDISWRNDNTSAWASQAVKYGDKYYFYYCTWDKTAGGKQSIGVAVSDSPAGPYTDIGNSLVNGNTMTVATGDKASNWNDIDPTVWIETVDGVEHRYLAWGNSIFYVCELNEDMTSIKDITGDGQVNADDIKQQEITNIQDGLVFTEAPWIYRRCDENGEYTGKYYMFGAFGWREQMGYATADSMYGPWEFQDIIMTPTATSNTNHPSVIDFNGKTYFIYHNGMLTNGSGYRRSVCVQELQFNDDGSVNALTELSTGIDGTAVTISSSDGNVYHEPFVNSAADSDYPISKSVKAGDVPDEASYIYADKWEIESGKTDTSNESYVSIQSVDKPGLYISVNAEGDVVLTQDADGNQADNMTFKTVKALNGSSGVSFESVKSPGKFLTVINGELILSRGTKADACSFDIKTSDITPTALPSGSPTAAPSTDAPSTDAPSTDAPSTDAPSTDVPSTDAPSPDAPATAAPTATAVSVERTKTSITVSEPVIGYKYALKDTNGNIVAEIEPTADNPEVTFDNLTKSTTYTLEVTDSATNEIVSTASVKTRSSTSSGGGGWLSSVISTPNPTATASPSATEDPSATAVPADKSNFILTIDKKEASVWGEEKVNDVAPVIVNDRTMMPARFVAENLGAKVEWNQAEQKVTITKDDIVIIITIGAETALVNGKEQKLDSPAYVTDDTYRTYTPVRFISENLGYNVEWNQDTKQVIITE